MLLRSIVAAIAPEASVDRGAEQIIHAADAAARRAAALLGVSRMPPFLGLRHRHAALPPSFAPAAPETASDEQRAALRLLARVASLNLVLAAYTAIFFTAAWPSRAQCHALHEAEQQVQAAHDTLLAAVGWDGSEAAPVHNDRAGTPLRTVRVVSQLRRIVAAVIAPTASTVDAEVAAGAASAAVRRTTVLIGVSVNGSRFV